MKGVGAHIIKDLYIILFWPRFKTSVQVGSSMLTYVGKTNQRVRNVIEGVVA